MKNDLPRPKSKKQKDIYIFNNVKNLLHEIDFWNQQLYPKKPISVKEIIDEISMQALKEN